MTDGKIMIGRSATPEEEAEEFATVDERRQARENEHQTNLLKIRMGLIGQLIGSENPTINVSIAILVPLFLLLALFGVMSAYHANLGSLIEGLLKTIALVIGVTVGAMTTRPRD